MKTTEIDTFSDLDRETESFSKSSLFRGVANSSHELLPSLFRHISLTDIDVRETNLMWIFKTSAKAILQREPSSDLEWLVVAQHHGLPTRLLDWSLSPLVACFFAVQSLTDDDAAIYIFDRQRFMREEDVKLSALQSIVAFFPSHATQRVTAQSGMFTVHPTSQMVLDGNDITKLIIPGGKKSYFMRKLVKYGIHHATMFPDLDGLSRYIKYQNNY